MDAIPLRTEFFGVPRLAFWALILALLIISTPASVAFADDQEVDETYGPESHGLRCRIVTVSSETDDESPDFTGGTDVFSDSDQLTFLVELNNVSDKPITLLGVRYGENYPTAKGKLNTRFLGPHLFDFQFTDEQGEPVQRAERFFVSQFMVLSGASTHEIDPGESLPIVLRPAKFIQPTHYVLPAGKYRAKVRYRGPSEETVAEIAKHWPDKAQAKAWTHEVTSREVAFSIAADPAAVNPSDLVWGPAKDGLQAALEYRIPGYVLEDPTEAPGIPLKTNVGVVFHVKNVSDKPITFVSETSRQDDRAHVRNANGEKVNVSGTFFSGWPIDVRWNLKPGDVATLNVLAPAINQIKEPGEYSVHYDIRLNSRVSHDADGNQTFPAKQDWQDVLTTGVMPLVFRARTIDDDVRAKPPHFVGKLQFVGENGEPVTSGAFTFRGEIQSKYHKDRIIKPELVSIPDCTTKPSGVTVRADGFEEAIFYDVKFAEGKTTVIKLKPAAPARFRLLSSIDGSPISGAKVRYFNKTSAQTTVGPYPSDGIEGPVWAISDDDGAVILNSLQKINPYYEKQGAALYYFYIEPSQADLAPHFIGPLKAGQDLGNVKLGAFVEVSGEVHGTPQDLDRFAAEWDQPFVQKTENPDGTWLYANSQRLKTQRDGAKLTFQLTGLRPGKLRIISNFGPRPHKTSHSYSRREVGETDLLVEVDLEKPTTKVVITPEGLK